MGVLFKEGTSGATKTKLAALQKVFPNLDLQVSKSGVVSAEFYKEKCFPVIKDMFDAVRQKCRLSPNSYAILIEDRAVGHSLCAKIVDDMDRKYTESKTVVHVIPAHGTAVLQPNDYVCRNHVDNHVDHVFYKHGILKGFVPRRKRGK